ncbi:mannose-6-phosphate isomerase-like protein (cupin superfamily) [Pontibacter ummariensis]|uniref:Mannose-6-phosphate isomerase, cupin superfamily n=1 Tax=Pontibacter ummariensis TaxID=1610492 RepID=A0A239BEL1_9BACT|nr:cupin domain-containing protein [Pontibacter ummariensis]PRY16488.1 mannose-6-phosphate isomerase-like protein (cupin superfamily) [Pontibacter ummariensis]SNS06062.1 Mannose-6-phosphate isomerase, cupin superfamily [Pontibacter ummariensis]
MKSEEIEKVNLADKFNLIKDHWNPRIVGELNGQQVKIAKFLGPFEWHHHEHEDEFFLVVKGQFELHLRDKVLTLNPGEFTIVPRGVEHKPVANEEAEVLMFEPASTVNTGNLQHSERTRTNLEKL